jgi:uncharacterized protein
MHIAITGASGFVGSALTTSLRAAGQTVVRLVRPSRANEANVPDTATWNTADGSLDTARLGQPDAVVHLAGATIASRWTTARKRAIADSRIPATAKLCATLARLPVPPRVLVAASAVGFYGDRGDELLDENSAPGTGFLADVARAWEASTQPAADAGVRVVNLRIGMVVDPDGGALARMLPPFRLGVGGRLGHGRQWMSWITRADLLRVIDRTIGDETLRGPVLAVAPAPVTNREFTRTLGTVLHRPAVFPVPAFVLRLLFGEMADEVLLGGQRAMPRRLLAAGFTFEHATLDVALRALLTRPTT